MVVVTVARVTGLSSDWSLGYLGNTQLVIYRHLRCRVIIKRHFLGSHAQRDLEIPSSCSGHWLINTDVLYKIYLVIRILSVGIETNSWLQNTISSNGIPLFLNLCSVRTHEGKDISKTELLAQIHQLSYSFSSLFNSHQATRQSDNSRKAGNHGY